MRIIDRRAMFSPFIFHLLTINSRRLNDNDIYTDYKQISNAHARSVYEINIAYIGSASTIAFSKGNNIIDVQQSVDAIYWFQCVG